MSGVPATAGFGVAAIATAMLDCTTTFVKVLARLLDVFPSNASLDTRASFSSTPVVCGLMVAVTVIVDDVAPLARVPALQTVGCAGFPAVPDEQVPPVIDTPVIVTPAGTSSVMTTLVAADGPVFFTWSVQLIPLGTPAMAVAGPFLVRPRSASAVTVRFTSALLFVRFGSGVGLLAVATSSMFIPSLAVTV